MDKSLKGKNIGGFDKDKPLEINVLNSELTIAKERRAFLTYPAEGLADCTLEELEDGICFYFDTDGSGLTPSKDVFKKPIEQQYRFLINCAALERLYAEYVFSLSTDNLLVDINLAPKVLLRDAKLNGGNTYGESNENGTADGNSNNNGNNGFLLKYKALIGSFLISKYSYADFEKGGSDLYKKDKLMLELSKMESVAEIKERLLKEYQKTTDKIAQTRHSVSKRSVLFSRIAIPFLTAAFLTAGFFAGLAYFYEMPFTTQVVAANEAYVAGNHLGAQRALADFPVERLSRETKHILSRSYVSTEPISPAQRDTILASLTLITDTSIFDYWIHLGRLDFYEAIDIAQRFGDTELLLFAFIKQEAIVRADPIMPGAEKVELLNYLERRIDELQRTRENAADAMANDENDNETD